MTAIGTYRKCYKCGCPMCLFGMQFDGIPNRLQRMYYDDNRAWVRVLTVFGFKKILDFMISNGHTEYRYYPDEIKQEDREFQYNITESVAAKKKREIEKEIAALKKADAQEELDEKIKTAQKYKKEVKNIKKKLEELRNE